MWKSAAQRSESVSKHFFFVFIEIIFGSWASCFASCMICTVSLQLAWLVAWTGFICRDEETGRVGLLHPSLSLSKVFHMLKFQHTVFKDTTLKHHFKFYKFFYEGVVLYICIYPCGCGQQHSLSIGKKNFQINLSF